jgi:hypothetical protein
MANFGKGGWEGRGDTDEREAGEDGGEELHCVLTCVVCLWVYESID